MTLNITFSKILISPYTKNLSFFEKRMVNTMDAIMSTIFSFICRILPPHPRLFTDSFLQIKVALLQIKDLITSIMDIFKKLTTIDFCCHDLNIWTEGPYCNCSAEKLCLRLDTILQLRSTHQEMRKILSKNRRYEFELLHSFEVRYFFTYVLMIKN